MSWQLMVSIAFGGAIGAVLRYLTLHLIGAPSGFPLGTLLVNICGSFAIGIVYVLLVEKGVVAEIWRHLLMVGLLGGFTTFSAFSLETVYLLESGRLFTASLYIVLSVFLCILAAFSAILLTRLF